MMLVRLGSLSLLLVAFTEVVRAGRPLPSWAVKIAMDQGPNTCVVEEVPGTSKKFWTDCRFFSHRKICGQKTILRYECCEGYERKRGSKGCMSVKPLKDLLATVEDIGAKKFAEFLRRSDLGDALRSGRDAFTLFAPTDEAFDQHGFGRGSAGPFIHKHHVVRHRFVDSQLEGGEAKLGTLHQGNSVYVNKFSSGGLTVDCVPVVRKNVLATNGIVHLIDGILDPLKNRKLKTASALTVDTRFSKFSRWLQETGISEDLDRKTEMFTLLAPTDEAFGKYPRSHLERISNDTEAKRALVENHVVRKVVCPAAIIEGSGKLRTMTGSQGGVEVGCDSNGVTMAGNRISGEYVVTENGIIIVVDDVMVPDRARSVIELAQKNENLTTWLELAEAAGLRDTMEIYGDYTFFAPTNEAFREYLGKEEIAEVKADANKARDLILFHGTQGILQEDQIVDDKAVMSLDEENKLRLGAHRTGFSVENGMMELQAEVRGRNGIIHPISKVLIHPRLSAGDYLRKDGRFKNFLKLMHVAMERNPLLLESVSGSKDFFTFFVPSDEAFAKLRVPKVITALDTQPEYVDEFVRNHILPKLVCSKAFAKGLTYRLQSMLNTHFAYVDKDGHITVGKANVTEKDISTTNGIVHVIDRVLLPKRGVHENSRETLETATSAGATRHVIEGGSGQVSKTTSESGSQTGTSYHHQHQDLGAASGFDASSSSTGGLRTQLFDIGSAVTGTSGTGSVTRTITRTHERTRQTSGVNNPVVTSHTTYRVIPGGSSSYSYRSWSSSSSTGGSSRGEDRTNSHKMEGFPGLDLDHTERRGDIPPEN